MMMDFMHNKFYACIILCKVKSIKATGLSVRD